MIRSQPSLWAGLSSVAGRLTCAILCYLLGSLCSLSDLHAWQTDKIYPGELAGLDQSEALLVDDDQPLTAQQDFLLRLLYRARKATPESLGRFAEFSQDVSLEEVKRNPKRYRGWVFRLQGVAQRAEWFAAPGGDEPDALKKYCRVELQTAEGQKVIVYAVEAPRAWTEGQPRNLELQAECACFGFFAVRPTESAAEVDPGATAQESSAAPIFVARRIEWYPQSLSPLAGNGFDWGLLDLARQQNLRPLSEEEIDAFYGLLSAAARTEPAAARTPSAGFFDLLKDPLQMIGQAVEFETTIRRVVPVAANPRHQLKDNRFWQLDGFVRLGDTPVEIRGSQGEPIRYQTRFPVTIDTLNFSGEPSAYSGRRVKVRGWLYRFWRYDSEFTERIAAGEGQIAPLIMAHDLEILPETSGGVAARLAYLAIAAAAMSIGFVWWVTRRKVPGRPDRPALPERIEL